MSNHIPDTGKMVSEATKELARHQPCGCIVCYCENDVQCQGCGAKHCGTHEGRPPNPVYADHIPEASKMIWQPIESAPKDGTEILAWRDNCGIFIASYTSLDCFPMSQSEIDRLDEETLYSKDWFTQWPQALRLESSEVPTHWMPLPKLPETQK